MRPIYLGEVMKSQYGDRDTVGTTYIEAQKNADDRLLVADVNSQMVPDLIDDMNSAIQSNPFEGRPFYVNIAEKRDAQMQNSFRRKIVKTLYRPFPEFSTYVLYMTPRTQTVCYCWDLPHHTEMINVLYNTNQHDDKYVQSIREWRINQLDNFGFLKVSMSSISVEGYEKKIIHAYQKSYLYYCQYIGMDEKAVETEKRFGFFWLPNKSFKDLVINPPDPIISMYSVA